jgi:tRNA dimethylallyltransferase
MNPPAPTVLPLLLGATATGKSAVALFLAQQMGAELLSADSMKNYRRLEIGVAKPTPAERAAVAHHLIDWKEPWESCSTAEWLAAAEEVVRGTAARGVPLIAEGGTALYLKALREGIFSGPGRSPEFRARLEEEARARGPEELHARLRARDPAAARRILPGDLRRIIRALEVLELTGRPISAHQSQWGRLRGDLQVRAAGLAVERKELYRRIDARVDRMFAAGWVEECRGLMKLEEATPERRLSREALQAIGYRTIFAHLRGELDLEETRARIRYDTHHFARRQESWFRRFPEVSWVAARPGAGVEELAAQVQAAWERR